MPRIARGETVGGIYHVINRGNMRMRVFEEPADYDCFLELLKTGLKKEAVELHAYCLMPNHFHLLLVPAREGSLSRLMQWVMTSHVRYYHKKNKTSGHIWQGRYKSFMVEQESYYITLIRYIEANALRAGLVKRAEAWEYGSLHDRSVDTKEVIHEPLMALPDDWTSYVNEPIYPHELEKIRNSVNRQAPLGEPQWQEETAICYGLLSTLRSWGRPKK